MSDINNTTIHNGNSPSADEIVINKLADSKTNSYGSRNDNFVIPTELTVVITLNEYRKLVAKDAEAAYSYAKKEQECAALKANVNELTKKIESLQTAIDVLKGVAQPMEETNG